MKINPSISSLASPFSFLFPPFAFFPSHQPLSLFSCSLTAYMDDQEGKTQDNRLVWCLKLVSVCIFLFFAS